MDSPTMSTAALPHAHWVRQVCGPGRRSARRRVAVFFKLGRWGEELSCLIGGLAGGNVTDAGFVVHGRRFTEGRVAPVRRD